MQLRTFKTFKHMAPIKSEAAYRAAMKRIEELLPLVNDNTPVDDPNYPGCNANAHQCHTVPGTV